MSEAPDRANAWTELEALLFECLERPDAERATALDELCTRHPQHATTLRQRFARLCALGFVGTSGNAPPDTPHLHFAITKTSAPFRRHGGTPINPYAVLR